ncbi:phage holin family protein [Nesterenkonia sp. LB17]|uniref:phage holin family protein n=1 Tax=Nesterenkonia sp. LB17 TaxID=2901230 RepID=UPI001F4D04D3|nr:phage holin family protein [Nesterenkonia sp. LB17]MCH8565796.1 phage holin family protein [Nesterenkonia sp. LB17]
MSHPAKPPEPAVPELLTRLSEQTSRLVRDEVRLAQAELTAKARQGGIGAGFLSVGGILAWFGVGVLITTPAEHENSQGPRRLQARRTLPLLSRRELGETVGALAATAALLPAIRARR